MLTDLQRTWATGQREIIAKYMNVHHQIQEAERQNQAEAILRARELDVYGQPKEVFMLFDGFSIFKGVTPKYGKGNYGGSSKTQKEEVSHFKLLMSFSNLLTLCAGQN